MTATSTRTASPPVPSAADLDHFRADPLRALPRLFERYGDPFCVPSQAGPMVLTADPATCEQIMKRHLDRGPLHRRTEPAQGPGITIQSGEEWRRTRAMITPLFTHRHLKALSDLVADGARRGLDRLSAYAGTGETVDLMAFMPSVTMGVLVHAMFSDSLRPGEMEAMIADYAHISRWKGGLIRTAFEAPGTPVPGEREGIAARDRIDEVIYRVIAERRREGVARQDLLQLLVDARYEEDGSELSDEDVRNNTTTLFIAGFDTTSFGLCWTLAAAMTSGRGLAPLVECAEQLGGRLPGVDDIPRLAYLKAAFDEGLRLQGHPFIPRQLETDETIGGYRLPAGTMVTMSTWVLHRNPALWERPHEFVPERYLGEEGAGRSRWQSLPFGGGPRVCIGINFAYMEATYVLALLLGRYRLELDPGWELRPAYVFNVILDGGLPVTVTEASSSSTVTSAG
ncbi:MAG: hypothetical protein QOI86_3258 [Actinomycetota bacterium]|nr:hypothetical protein [Actinomycetota bacterium]